MITKAAILSSPAGKLHSSCPNGFVPEEQGIEDVIKALVKNNTDPIAERGVVLGNGVPVCTPGKLEGGVIYSTNGEQGSVIILTRANLLIGVYEENPTGATQLMLDCSKYMVSTGR